MEFLVRHFGSCLTSNSIYPPFILVTTENHLRNHGKNLQSLSTNHQRVIDRQSGHDKARKIEGIKYVECSALDNIRLEEVFDETIKETVMC